MSCVSPDFFKALGLQVTRGQGVHGTMIAKGRLKLRWSTKPWCDNTGREKNPIGKKTHQQ